MVDGNANVNALVSVPVDKISSDPSRTYYLTDLITGEVISGLPDDFKSDHYSCQQILH